MSKYAELSEEQVQELDEFLNTWIWDFLHERMQEMIMADTAELLDTTKGIEQLRIKQARIQVVQELHRMVLFEAQVLKSGDEEDE